jgi:protein tyrosine phosphatase (PTP) superfamily phosphohydrolase (DUF442 family)
MHSTQETDKQKTQMINSRDDGGDDGWPKTVDIKEVMRECSAQTRLVPSVKWTTF